LKKWNYLAFSKLETMSEDETLDPDARAKYLHSLLQNPFTKSRVTIAVLTTNKETVVGTSEPQLRNVQKQALNSHEVEAIDDKNDKHAEEKVIAKAKEMGLEAREIGASRPICSDCEALIKQEGIVPKTKLKKKKSKNRP
jgi:uncharacterized protein YfeS